MTTIEQRISAVEARLDAMQTEPLPPPPVKPTKPLLDAKDYDQLRDYDKFLYTRNPPPDKAVDVAARISDGMGRYDIAALIREAYPEPTAERELLRDAVKALRFFTETSEHVRPHFADILKRAERLGI